MQTDVSKMVNYLNSKWHGTPCPLCGARQFAVQETLFQLMEFNQGNMVVGGPVIPVVPITCENCGNTYLINAMKAGLVQ